MYKKILVGGITAAAIIGAGGTALAVSGSDTVSGSQSGSTAAAGRHAGKHTGKDKGGHSLLRHLEHGSFVSKTKKGSVTHDLIRGSVTAVSSTSITVQAADKVSETFVVTKDTKVRVRQDGKGTTAAIASVAKGDRVFVAGTGTGTKTARHVVDIKGAK